MTALCVHRRPPEELTDRQINLLLAFGRQRAAIVQKLQDAARAGDREAVWQYAIALTHCEDESGRI
jgi:hypothetical protein